MNKTQSEPAQSLPRLKSHKQFRKPISIHHSDGRNTEQETFSNRITSSQKRTLTRGKSERHTLQSANGSKAVKYETINTSFQKKADALLSQSHLLDKEINEIRQEINQLKIQNKINGEDATSVTSQVSRITSKRSNNGFIRADPKLITNKLNTLRKKIDKQNEKNKLTQVQIDKVRREITTIKKLNSQLQHQLAGVNQKYQYEMATSTRLQSQIASENQELQKKKKNNIRQNAHLIKNYQSILKRLEQEIALGKLKQNNESRTTKIDFYITDIYSNPNHKKKVGQLGQNIRDKKSAAQTIFLKEKIQQYEKEFNEIKEKTGSESIEEATNKFREQYQNNYGQYCYINERFAHLEQLKSRNKELNERYSQMKYKIQSKIQNQKYAQIVALQQKIQKSKDQKNEINKKINDNDALFHKLRQFVIDFIKRIPLEQFPIKYSKDSPQDLQSFITPNNLQEFLQQILIFKESSKLQNRCHLDLTKVKNSNSNSARTTSISPLEEHFMAVKSETPSEKDKLFDRQEFIKNKDYDFHRKKIESKHRLHRN